MPTSWKVFLLAEVLTAAVAQGAPAAYTFTGNVTGTLNGTPFSNATMVITVTGNTSNVITGSNGHYELDYAANTATFMINGVGSGTFSDSGSVDDNQQVFSGSVGLFDNSKDWLVLIEDATIGGSALASYNLTTSIGPTAAQASNPSLSDFVNVPTSAGNLTISSESNITFQATVGAPAVPVLVSPANGAAGVSQTPSLTWNASTGATSYDVYIGTSSPPPLVANTTGTSYSPGTLTAGTTYYWQVVAKNSAGSASSSTWSFATVTAMPSAPAAYTFTGNVTGTLNGTPFSNATMVLTVTGNTSNVFVSNGFIYELDYAANTATFTINGVGSGTFSDSGVVDDNQQAFSGSVGLSDTIKDQLITIEDAMIGGNAFASYTLTTSIGPTAPQASNPSAPDFVNVPTSLGNLTISSESNLIFQATVGLPAVPVLVSPANGAAGVSQTPSLTWNASTGATSYYVYIGTSSPPPLVGNTTGTSYSPGTLTAGTTYYWQVLAKNSNGFVSSSTWSFTTQVTPTVDIIALSAYLMTGPDNGSKVAAPSVGQTVYFMLDWQLTGASGSISVPEQALLDGAVYCGGPLPATNGTWTTWCPTGWVATAGTHTLTWNLNYTGSVPEINYNNDTVSEVFSVTAGLPPAPVLTSPANGATGVVLAPTLTWNASAGATSYDVYFGTAASPPLATNTTGTSYSPGTLTAGTTYYWQVVAKNSGGSASSATWSFTTQGSAAPTAPVLVSPANGATETVLTPTLSWNASSGAASYDVHFGTVSSPPLVTNTTATNYAPGTLNSGVTYYWQIVARNAIGSATSATWSFTTGTLAVGLRFVPVTPCRIADTRNADGPFGGPTMETAETRSFAIPQSACNIPVTALAYSLNVTVVPEGFLGYLALWPTGQPQPFVSTLNSYGGTVVANAAIVPAGTGGAVSVYVTNPTDVILDINGYFDTSTGATSYAFYPATPCRVADTRNATGQFGGPTMQANQSRDFPIPLSSCDIPATARAYSLNFTVVPQGFLGYLATWPTGQTQPNVSTLNSYTGSVVANAALVPAGTNESISVFVTNPTDVILDINGYFGAPGSPNALSFYPVTPCRVADTRNAAGPFGGPEMAAGTTRPFTIPASACSIPSTAVAYSLNVTVVPDGPLYYLSVWPTGVTQPLVSTLNSYSGSVLANAAIVPAGTNGAIDVFVMGQTQVILDINGYFAP